jgi:hypothetical protein
MYRTNLISARLFAGFIVAVVLLASSSLVHFYYQPAYSHVLSLDENASLLELFHLIFAQAKLVQTIFTVNIYQAHEHAKDATTTLSKNWTTVPADRDIVRSMLLPSLNALNELTRPAAGSTLSSSSSSSSYPEIKGEVGALDSILSQFTLQYIGKGVYKNSTIQALVISELANDISEKYGMAFGVAVNSSNMMMNSKIMAMPSMVMNDRQPASHASTTSSSSSYNTAPNSKDNTMNGMTNTMNSETKKVNAAKDEINSTKSSINNTTTILNVVDYQTAQALASEALETFNNDLKPVAPLNAIQANKEVQGFLQQLKDAIDNRAPLVDIMTIIHGHIHPILISTYKLRLKG